MTLRSSRQLALLALVGWLLTAPAPTPAAEAARSWNFRVYLDQDPIGYHNFTLSPRGELRELKSVAHYLVKILFVTAFHYDHHATEIWRGDCLDQLDSDSDDDGKLLAVHARSDGQSLAVEAPKGHYAASGCAMTFAYWNPLMLQQTHLINPETGEDLPVTVSTRGEEDITVHDQREHARHYHLQGQKLDIDLWYSMAGEWLALESATEKGRRLRYVLN